ncbi:hypothetical protein LGM89_32850 [Burkholderia sp. AU31624]|nr:hypothetical protein [Burkholderia sp. AU31624]
MRCRSSWNAACVRRATRDRAGWPHHLSRQRRHLYRYRHRRSAAARRACARLLPARHHRLPMRAQRSRQAPAVRDLANRVQHRCVRQALHPRG